MNPTHTFDAIYALVKDGGWYSVADLGNVALLPGKWVDVLQAEGLIEVRSEAGGTVRVRWRRRMI